MKQFKHLIKPYIIWASILIVVPLILIVLYAFTSDGNEVLTYILHGRILQNSWKLLI